MGLSASTTCVLQLELKAELKKEMVEDPTSYINQLGMAFSQKT